MSKKKMTLREIYDIYIEFRKSEGKVITKDSYWPLKSMIYFIENKNGTPYMTQKLFKEWREERTRTYNALTVIHKFFAFAKENGYLNIICPPPVYPRTPKTKLFDKPLEKSVVSDMMTKFFEWRKRSVPLNVNYHYILIRFNNFCKDNYPDAQILTQEMIEAYAEMKGNECALSRNRRMAPIALFIEYAQGNGCTGIHRPADLPAKPNIGRSNFHIFSRLELEQFFDLTNKLKKHSTEPLLVYQRKCLVVGVFFRLLYSTGMQIKAALNLKTYDVDLEKGIVTFNNSHINDRKMRLAVSESMHELLKRYDAAMNKLMPGREFFFPNPKGKPYSLSGITKHFMYIWNQISDVYACPSDFRVTFAIENINSWNYDGTEWNIDLVVLSRAMGLCNTAAAQKYLTLVPRYQKMLHELSGKNIEKLLPDLNKFKGDETEN